MAKTKTSVSDAAKSNGTTTRAKAADSPKAKPAASPKAKPAAVTQAPKAKQQQAAASPKANKPAAASPKAKPAAEKPKAVAEKPKAANGVATTKKQNQQQQQSKKGAKGAAQNKNTKNQPKQQQQQVPKGPNYFEVPSYVLLEGIVIALGMMLLAGAVYAPNTIPWFLGPIATIAKDLSRNYNAILKIVLFAAAAAHIGEGLYAVHLCRQKRINLVPTIKWWIQTTLLGHFSLRLLLKHGNAGGKKKK